MSELLERIREQMAQSVRLDTLCKELTTLGGEAAREANRLNDQWSRGDVDACVLIERADVVLRLHTPAPVEEEKPKPPEPEPDPGPGDEPDGGWEAADFISGPDDVVEVVDNRKPKSEPPAETATDRRTATPAEQEQRIVSWLFGILDDIAPALPAEVALGYLHCWRLADFKTGEFYISHERMAERLGAANRSTGKRVMRTLRAAGVVRIKVKGGKHRATLYQLAPRSAFQRGRVIAAVVSTWMNYNPKMLAQETGSRETLKDLGNGFEGDAQDAGDHPETGSRETHPSPEG